MSWWADTWADIRRKFDMNKLVRVATLPKGDHVYVAEEVTDLGFTGTFPSRQRENFGRLRLRCREARRLRTDCNALTSADDVVSLTEFNPT